MTAVSTSGSTSGAAAVEMETEAPPSGSEDTKDSVNTAVTTISSKAVQDGPPRSESPKDSDDPRTKELRQQAIDYDAEAKTLHAESDEMFEKADAMREDAEVLLKAGDEDGADALMDEAKTMERAADRVKTAAERLDDRSVQATERADERDKTAERRSEGKADSGDTDADAGTDTQDADTSPTVAENFVSETTPAVDDASTRANDVWNDANGKPPTTPAADGSDSKSSGSPTVAEQYVNETSSEVEGASTMVNDVWNDANGKPQTKQAPSSSGTDTAKSPTVAEQYVSDTSSEVEGTSTMLNDVWSSATNGGSTSKPATTTTTTPASTGKPAAEISSTPAKGNAAADKFVKDTQSSVDNASSKLNSLWDDAINGSKNLSKAAASPVKQPKDGFVTSGGDVFVDIKPSTSGYDNTMYWSTDNFKTKHAIGVDGQVGSVMIGNFPPGTKIQFGIDNGQGDFFVHGDAKHNKDKIQHAKAENHADGGMTIGFEDLHGGGDMDFDDAVFHVREQPRAAAPAARNDQKLAKTAVEKFDGTGVNIAPFNNDKQLGIHELAKAGVTDAAESKFLRHGLGDGNGFINEQELVQAQKDGLIKISDDGKIAMTDKGKAQAALQA